MDTKTPQPDTPFRSGVSGKYKLLIKAVEFKYGNYECGLPESVQKVAKLCGSVLTNIRLKWVFGKLFLSSVSSMLNKNYHILVNET